MPDPITTKDADYWSRARSWAWEETQNFTLQKAIPPVFVAILQHFVFHLRAMGETLVIVGTLLGGYAFLHGVEFTWKLLFKAPPALDKGRNDESHALREEVRTLSDKLKRSPADERLYAMAQDALQKLGDRGKTVLCHLKIHGTLVFAGVVDPPPAPGMTIRELRDALDECVREHLVTVRSIQQPGGFDYIYEIAPGMKAALDELLYQVTPACHATPSLPRGALCVK